MLSASSSNHSTYVHQKDFFRYVGADWCLLSEIRESLREHWGILKLSVASTIFRNHSPFYCS